MEIFISLPFLFFLILMFNMEVLPRVLNRLEERKRSRRAKALPDFIYGKEMNNLTELDEFECALRLAMKNPTASAISLEKERTQMLFLWLESEQFIKNSYGVYKIVSQNSIEQLLNTIAKQKKSVIYEQSLLMNEDYLTDDALTREIEKISNLYLADAQILNSQSLNVESKKL